MVIFDVKRYLIAFGSSSLLSDIPTIWQQWCRNKIKLNAKYNHLVFTKKIAEITCC